MRLMTDMAGVASMLRGWRARPCEVAAGLVWLGLLLVGVGLLAHAPSVRQTPTSGTARFLTPEIRRGRTMGQIVTPEAHAFNHIVIQAESASPDPHGDVVLEIYDQASGQLVRRVTAPTRRVVEEQAFAIEFSPIEGSRLGQYRLEVTMPEAADGEGISLWAFDGRVGEDALIVDGTHALSELVFETGSTPVWTRLLRHVLEPRPGAPGIAVLLMFFLLANASVVLIFRTIICGDLVSEVDHPPAPTRRS